MKNTNERIYKFGDYCLDTAKSIIRSHHSMDDIFEVFHETRDLELKERLVSFIKKYLNYIDNCIKEADGLLQTLPFVANYVNNIVDIKELKEMRDKLIEIKKDTETRMPYVGKN